MELYQDDTELMDDGIFNLRELILVLWKRKKIIISVALIAAILSGIFSFFVIKPVYQAKMNIVINMPETYHTKFGDYALPIKTNSEYISLITSNDVLTNTIKKMGYDSKKVTIDNLQERIKIDINTNSETQNVFNIVTEADSPEEAKQLSKCLYDSYIEFLNIITIQGSLDYYYNLFSTEINTLEVSLDSTRKILSKNKQLLAETSPTINQKKALNEIQKQINASVFIMDNVINPNYTLIEANIIENKQSINSMEDTINVDNTYLGELDTIKSDLEQYYDTTNFESIKSSIVKITDSSISLPSQPIASNGKTSPSNIKNICVGTFLGGMIAVFVVLIKWWWQNGDVNDKDTSKEHVKDNSQTEVANKKLGKLI